MEQIYSTKCPVLNKYAVNYAGEGKSPVLEVLLYIHSSVARSETSTGILIDGIVCPEYHEKKHFCGVFAREGDSKKCIYAEQFKKL